jgi:glycosyltransferase involved in cell wall biosynthesis
MNETPKLLLFEMSFGGHYASYIRYLVEYWRSSTILGHLDVLVSPRFLRQHEDVVEIAQGQPNLRFTAITTAEAAALVPRSSSLNRARRALQEWRLLRRYAPRLGTTHCLLLYFDTFQSAFILRRPAPCRISGIYFRPTLHYDQFEMTRLSWKDRLQQRREAWVLPWVLKHSALHTLFCLDPFATKRLQQFPSTVRRVYLPDPVPLPVASQAQADELDSLGILPGRTVCLLFGSLDARKGIHPLLEAVLLLPDDLGRKLCLLMVGKIDPHDHAVAVDRIRAINRNGAVQLIVQDAFIPDSAIDAYFRRADLILAPYQRHVGMSAILVRAAAARKPLISSSFGLMGELARRYRLGLTVDSTVPRDIAQALSRCLSESLVDVCDTRSMARFSRHHSVDVFSETIFHSLLDPSPSVET